MLTTVPTGYRDKTVKVTPGFCQFPHKNIDHADIPACQLVWNFLHKTKLFQNFAFLCYGHHKFKKVVRVRFISRDRQLVQSWNRLSRDGDQEQMIKLSRTYKTKFTPISNDFFKFDARQKKSFFLITALYSLMVRLVSSKFL